jgi:transcriptional regulator with XRE-family HTH domain
MNETRDADADVGEVGQAHATKDVLPVVAANLRRLRTRKGYSLERLARASSVSRAMLSQIELAQSALTINVLWKIASALSVPFSALLGGEGETPTSIMRARGAARLTSADGSFSSRPLFPFGQGPRRTEFYELRLAPHGVERAQAHPLGTTENLIVAAGSVAIVVGRERHLLDQGDAIVFKADVEHSYENLSTGESAMYLVTTYAVDVERGT